MNRSGMLLVSLWDVNQSFWFHRYCFELSKCLFESNRGNGNLKKNALTYFRFLGSISEGLSNPVY